MGFRGLKMTVISEGSVPAADSARTSRVKLRFSRVSRRERIWDVRLRARENHLSYAISTLRWIPLTKAIIIPWEIREVQPQVQLAAPKCQKRLLAEGGGRSCGRLGDRTRYGDKKLFG